MYCLWAGVENFLCGSPEYSRPGIVDGGARNV